MKDILSFKSRFFKKKFRVRKITFMYFEISQKNRKRVYQKN